MASRAQDLAAQIAETCGNRLRGYFAQVASLLFPDRWRRKGVRGSWNLGVILHTKMATSSTLDLAIARVLWFEHISTICTLHWFSFDALRVYDTFHKCHGGEERGRRGRRGKGRRRRKRSNLLANGVLLRVLSRVLSTCGSVVWGRRCSRAVFEVLLHLTKRVPSKVLMFSLEI